VCFYAKYNNIQVDLDQMIIVETGGSLNSQLINSKERHGNDHRLVLTILYLSIEGVAPNETLLWPLFILQQLDYRLTPILPI